MPVLGKGHNFSRYRDIKCPRSFSWYCGDCKSILVFIMCYDCQISSTCLLMEWYYAALRFQMWFCWSDDINCAMPYWQSLLAYKGLRPHDDIIALFVMLTLALSVICGSLSQKFQDVGWLENIRRLYHTYAIHTDYCYGRESLNSQNIPHISLTGELYEYVG